MKRVLAFVLMLTLVLSCGIVAFAAGSPSKTTTGGGGAATAALPAATFGLKVCDKDDKVIDTVPKQKVVYATGL